VPVAREAGFRSPRTGGLLLFGLLYSIAQSGELIVMRQFQADGPFIDIASALAMFVLAIKAWRSTRKRVERRPVLPHSPGQED
jgi:hypothetical protein